MEGAWVPHLYMLTATYHHWPILNGVSGFEPPLHERLRTMLARRPIDSRLCSLLERVRCEFVLVHADHLADQGIHIRAWLSSELRSGRLTFLRRVDSGVGGDWLFAVTRNCRACGIDKDRQLGHADAGSAQNLERMLQGKPTYNSQTFGMVDTPSEMETVQGALTVSGWALSPNGIANVRILLHNATRTYQATLADRQDVQAVYPWYPKVGLPGFTVTIPKRPRGVSRDTDVQVEIVDRAGRRVRLPDIPIDW